MHKVRYIMLYTMPYTKINSNSKMLLSIKWRSELLPRKSFILVFLWSSNGLQDKNANEISVSMKAKKLDNFRSIYQITVKAHSKYTNSLLLLERKHLFILWSMKSLEARSPQNLSQLKITVVINQINRSLNITN